MKEKDRLSLLSLKAKIFLAINLLAILVLLSFTIVNAESFDDCRTEPNLLWFFPNHRYCDGGDYKLFTCLNEENELIFVPTCTSGISSEEHFYFPLVLR